MLLYLQCTFGKLSVACARCSLRLLFLAEWKMIWSFYGDDGYVIRVCKWSLKCLSNPQTVGLFGSVHDIGTETGI